MGLLSACDPPGHEAAKFINVHDPSCRFPSKALSSSFPVSSLFQPHFPHDDKRKMGPVTFATDNNIRSGAVSDREAEAGILPSHGISLDVPGYDGAEGGRPALIQHM
jgi:hypothetical protein